MNKLVTFEGAILLAVQQLQEVAGLASTRLGREITSQDYSAARIVVDATGTISKLLTLQLEYNRVDKKNSRGRQLSQGEVE